MHGWNQEIWRYDNSSGTMGMPVNKTDVEAIQKAGMRVRMWNGSEPLYGQCRTLPDMDLREYCRLGATDIFTNAPERYCENRR